MCVFSSVFLCGTWQLLGVPQLYSHVTATETVHSADSFVYTLLFGDNLCPLRAWDTNEYVKCKQRRGAERRGTDLHLYFVVSTIRKGGVLAIVFCNRKKIVSSYKNRHSHLACLSTLLACKEIFSTVQIKFHPVILSVQVSLHLICVEEGGHLTEL